MLALGALAGLVLRHTVAAMVTTVIAYGPLVVALNHMRDALWPTVTGVYSLKNEDPLPDGASGVTWGYLTADGRRLPEETCMSHDSASGFRKCLADEGITQHFVDYHPASHFWPLQLVETGILLALAGLAVLLAFRVLRRRHG